MKSLLPLMLVLCVSVLSSKAQAASHHAYLGQYVYSNSFLMSAEGICRAQAEATATRGCDTLENKVLDNLEVEIERAETVAGSTFAGGAKTYCVGDFTYTCR